MCWVSALLGEHPPAGKQAAVVFADSQIHGDWKPLEPEPCLSRLMPNNSCCLKAAP
ncbi:Uncharacterised protein [Chlamydia abortus]|nr:Uncharacterised protein [Chlamydia abortus]